jgi:hypothetical protein
MARMLRQAKAIIRSRDPLKLEKPTAPSPLIFWFVGGLGPNITIVDLPKGGGSLVRHEYGSISQWNTNMRDGLPNGESDTDRSQKLEIIAWPRCIECNQLLDIWSKPIKGHLEDCSKSESSNTGS